MMAILILIKTMRIPTFIFNNFNYFKRFYYYLPHHNGLIDTESLQFQKVF